MNLDFKFQKSKIQTNIIILCIYKWKHLKEKKYYAIKVVINNDATPQMGEKHIIQAKYIYSI